MGGRDSGTQDDPDMAVGRSAIEAGDWDGAVNAMQRAVAATPLNADAYNWLGFAYRKLGNFDASFAAYREALRLDPGHRAAHEYIGEAFLLTGQLAQAEAHLAELARLCTPIPCEEHRELRQAIDDYKRKPK
jgi:Flp pilus assembly protein TadD